ncbi:hypothetical protein AB1Y20_008167 [Prymnesium parvum]|uniref:RNA polymerase II-associated protein 3 n=1 Tax=Prymnesium parvum TaxID=97485 RepID=A0AB34IVU7_PRYPA
MTAGLEAGMAVQLQMRRNVEQMHQTADDLTSFVNDIGKRDRSLRGVHSEPAAAKLEDDGTDEEEEAREIEAAKEELRRLAAEHVVDCSSRGADSSSRAERKASKGPKTHAQKYSEWEKYDVEGVVGKMEEREQNEERLRKEVVRLENKRLQAQARKQQMLAESASEALRQKGNKAFNSACYGEAVDLYTRALDHTPRSHVLYANRALALLKLQAHAEAEEDCDTALLLEPLYVKARLRRAQARQALCKYDGALEDLEVALEAEPRNVAARKQLQECRQLKAQSAPRQRRVAARLSVEHVDYDPENDNDPFVLSVAPLSSADPSNEPGAVPPVKNADALTASKPQKANQQEKERLNRVATPRADSFLMPATAADVERAWHSLKRAPEEFAAYARRLNPELVAKIFKHNLPSEMLSAFLHAVDTHYLPDCPALAFETLDALSRSGRFSILVMCLDKADVKATESIFAKLAVALPDQTEQIKKLKTNFL